MGPRRLAVALVVVVAAAGMVHVADTMASTTTRPSACSRWVTGWMAAPQLIDRVVRDETIRTRVRTTIGGSGIRLTLTNRFGTGPVRFERITVLAGGQRRDVMFGGGRTPETTVAGGTDRTSDPVPLDVHAGDDITVSFHVPGAARLTGHTQALRPTWIGTEQLTSTLGILAVDVLTSSDTGALAAIGDSLTDGTGATFGEDRRWTDHVARSTGGRVAVLNAGLAANLAARTHAPEGSASAHMEPRGVADRLAPDVLDRAGVTDVLVFAGINDILFGHDDDPAREVIAAHRRIVEDAHAAGLRVVGATLTPAGWSNDPAREELRQRVNTWIRTSGAFDEVVDFDRAVRDPGDPARLRPAYDASDGIHLNDAGYAAIAATVDDLDVGRAATTTSC